MAKPSRCYLPLTKIKLADGEHYCFRRLPFTEQTVDLLSVLDDDEVSAGAMARALYEAIRLSLSYDHETETIDHVMASGLIPLPTGDDPIVSEIMSALGAGGGDDGDEKKSAD